MKTDRLTELDIARGIAVIGMVLVHVYLYLCASDSALFYYICSFLGTPFAAPVFLTLLGANIVLAKNDNTKYLCRRGLKMTVMTVLYTSLGYALPYLIAYFVSGDPAHLAESIDFLFAVDLFQFSTLTFFFFAICRKFKLKDITILLIAAIISIVRQMFFAHVELTEPSFSLWLARLFVGTPKKSWFPFACWIMFPVAGRVFIQQVTAAADRRRFYKKSLCVSCLVVVVSLFINFVLADAFGWSYPLGSFDAYYYKMHILTNITFIAFVTAWISFCYLALPYIPQMIKNCLCSLSRNTTVIYCIHFPIIMYIHVLAFGETHKLNIIETLLLTVLLLIFGTLCANILKHIKQRNTAA